MGLAQCTRSSLASIVLSAVLVPLVLAATPAPPRTLLVATERLAPGPYDVTLPDKLGVLEASEHRTLALQSGGRLEEVAAEGASVTAGDEIARLAAALERSQVRQAELRLRDARAQLQRVAGLKRSQAASVKAHDDAITAVDLRTAELDAAREQLERMSLKAPFDGVVAETLVEPGEVVGAGTPVATLMQLDTLRLEVGIPGYQIGRVRPGAPVAVSVPALPGDHFEASVERVAPAAAKGGHLFEVEIRVANPEGRLRAGMSARGAIVTRRLEGVVVAPLESVVERGGRRTVFVIENDRARALDVGDAPLHGDHVVIEVHGEGIDLVVRGQHGLSDGAAVRVDNRVLGPVEPAS